MGSTSKDPTPALSDLIRHLAVPAEVIDNDDLFQGIAAERGLRQIEAIKVHKDLIDKTKVESHEVPIIAEISCMIFESKGAGINYNSLALNYRNKADQALKIGFLAKGVDGTLHFSPLVQAILDNTDRWDDQFKACRETLERIRSCPLDQKGMVSVSSYNLERGGKIGSALFRSFEDRKRELQPLDILPTDYNLIGMAAMPSLNTRRSRHVMVAYRGHVAAHFLMKEEIQVTSQCVRHWKRVVTCRRCALKLET